MSTQAATPWTDPAFAPGSLYGDPPEQKRLKPYRVEIGDRVFDQRAFTSNTTDRYHAYVGGIGSGKTVGGLIRMAANATEWNPGSLGAIVTPTSLGIKNAILPKLHEWGFMDTWEYHGPQSEAPGLHLPDGTRILLESANNERKIERLRGFDLAWFWLDEAAYVPKRAFDVLMGRLRVGNYRNGFITTTPKGYNWVFDRFHPEGDRHLESTNTVLGVPSYANPHLPLDYRKDILGEYKGQFQQQEVEGAFVRFEGLVYPWFDTQYKQAHVIDAVPDGVRFEEVFYGVDWGFYPHPAAILAMARSKGNDVYVLGEHYDTRNTVDDLGHVIVGTKQDRHSGFYDQFGRGPVYCDPSEPSNIETFQRMGINATKADNSVTPGIQHVSAQADRLYILSSCQSLINELNQYQYKEGGDEPEDVNDHAADALRYGLFTHEQKGSPSVGVAFG